MLPKLRRRKIRLLCRATPKEPTRRGTSNRRPAIHLPAAAELPFQAVLVALAALMLVQRHRPARFFALATLAFVVSGLWQPGFNRIESMRSFFGVHQLVETSDNRYRLLYHGTTLHGAERIHAAGTAPSVPEPLTYFYFGGPISESIEAVRIAAARTSGPSLRSIRTSFGSRATRVSSASYRPVFPGFRSCSAMRGSRSPHRHSAMISSSSMPFPPT